MFTAMTFDSLAKRLRTHPQATVGPGVSEREIIAAERALGVPIEGGYRKFLNAFGWAEIGWFEIYGLGDGVPSHLHLVQMTISERAEAHPLTPHHLLPIFNDGAGNLHCLDTTTGDEPAIVFWDHERSENQTPDPQAESFAQWLGDLLDAVDKKS